MKGFKITEKELHGPSMLPDKAKFVVCSIIRLVLSFWMKHPSLSDFDYILDLVSADFSGPNHRIGQGCAGRA